MDNSVNRAEADGLSATVASEWLRPFEEARAAEGISKREMYNRVESGEVASRDRRAVDGKRGVMIDVRTLSPEAQNRWGNRELERVQAMARAAQGPRAEQPADASGQLRMFPKNEIDTEIFNIPPGPGRNLAMRRFGAIQPVLNHDYAALKCRSHSGLIRAIARTERVSPNTVRRWVEKFNESGGKIEALADRPPGPPPGTGTVLDASMQAYLTHCWQVRKLTKMQTYRQLNGYLRDKQRGVGASWSYVRDGTGEDFVSRGTVERFIEERLGGENNPWRRGGTALKDAAGYIDRLFDEYAGDAWCIDEWELDGIFYEPLKRSVLVQNPHGYLLTIIDERTTFILGRKLVRSLCPDSVLDLLEETIRAFGKPKFFVRDKGGHFRSKVGGRVTVHKHGELVETAIGALGKLGVGVRSPGGEKNPRSNRIECLHRIYADLARRDFGLSWCGTRRVNKDGINLRDLSEIDAHVQKHLRDHCQLGISGPVLLSMDDAERIIAAWVEEINLAPTDAKGCEGLTRLAAFKQFQPAEAERASRAVSDAELLVAFAEDYELKVREGGIVVVPGKPFPIRYSSAELIVPEFRGKKLRVTRARHDKSFVLVYARPGEPPIRAERRIPVGINDEGGLARESERLARTRKVLEQSRPVIDLSREWREVTEEPKTEPAPTVETSAAPEPEPVERALLGKGFPDLEE